MKRLIDVLILLAMSCPVMAGIPIMGNNDLQLDAEPSLVVPASLKYMEVGAGMGLTLLSYQNWLTLDGAVLNFGERKVLGGGPTIKVKDIKLPFDMLTINGLIWCGWGYDYKADVDYGKFTWKGFDCGVGLKF